MLTSLPPQPHPAKDKVEGGLEVEELVRGFKVLIETQSTNKLFNVTTTGTPLLNSY